MEVFVAGVAGRVQGIEIAGGGGGGGDEPF